MAFAYDFVKSIDTTLHVTAYLIFYCSMFQDSWLELKYFFQECPNKILTSEWIMFYIVAPVNQLVLEALVSFPKKQSDFKQTARMFHFLTNRFLMEYLQGVKNSTGKKKKFSMDHAGSNIYQPDVQLFVDFMQQVHQDHQICRARDWFLWENDLLTLSLLYEGL